MLFCVYFVLAHSYLYIHAYARKYYGNSNCNTGENEVWVYYTWCIVGIQYSLRGYLIHQGIRYVGYNIHGDTGFTLTPVSSSNPTNENHAGGKSTIESDWGGSLVLLLLFAHQTVLDTDPDSPTLRRPCSKVMTWNVHHRPNDESIPPNAWCPDDQWSFTCTIAVCALSKLP